MLLLTALISGVIAIPWILIGLLPLFLIALFALSFATTIFMFSTKAETFKFFSIKKIPNIVKSSTSHILVVDDDYLSVLPLIYLLEKRNHVVKFVSSGRKMLQELKKHSYDLIFLDLQMPQLTGDEALHKGDSLLATERKLPVVLYSSQSRKPELSAGFQHFYIQDFWIKKDIADLDEKLKNFFPRLGIPAT